MPGSATAPTPIARSAWPASSRSSASTGWRSRSSPTSSRRTPSSPTRVDIRVAAGEEEATRWGFRELIERGHVDVIQPDVTRCGGLSEALKIARDGERRGLACVPHAWKSGIIKAASLHLNAVLETAYFQEYCVAETPINLLLTRERMPVKDGWVAVPDKPGLGVELDPEILDRYAIGAKPLPVAQ